MDTRGRGVDANSWDRCDQEARTFGNYVWNQGYLNKTIIRTTAEVVSNILVYVDLAG